MRNNHKGVRRSQHRVEHEQPIELELAINSKVTTLKNSPKNRLEPGHISNLTKVQQKNIMHGFQNASDNTKL